MESLYPARCTLSKNPATLDFNLELEMRDMFVLHDAVTDSATTYIVPATSK